MNLPVQVPAGGIVVRLTFQSGLSVGPATYTYQTFNSSSHVEVQAEFFPHEPTFHVFDTTGATTGLAVYQPTGGSVTFSMTTPSHIPLLLALGTQAMVNPLLPTVTQLVSLDVVFAAGPVTTWALPPLPPGSVVYAQGLVIDSSGTLRSSNSVRGIWP